MAEHKIQGSDMLLFIDPTGGTNYDTVVCLTSVSQNDSVQPVDASSACGPDKSPGAVDISVTFEGQHLQDPDSGKISGTNLLQLLRAEQTIGWKLSPVSPQAGDEIQEGTGYLSELSSTYSYSEIGVFNGTIQPYGVPTITVQPGSPSLVIGQYYAGGNIAYLDNSGQHGFVVYGDGTSVAMDQWAIAYTTTGASGFQIGDGSINTAAINASVPSLPALSCSNGGFNGYNDWVMPSYDEMGEIIFQHLNGYFPALGQPFYWTSTENSNPSKAWKRNAADNSVSSSDKLLNIFDTVAIRYF